MIGHVILFLMYIVAIDFGVHIIYFAKTGRGKNAEILAPYKAIAKWWRNR